MEYVNDWPWIELETVTSTNDEAIKYDKRIIVTAVEQTNGRGRRGRSWIGLNGNLFLSINLNFEAHYLSRVIIRIGLTLLRTIREINPDLDVRLKWPNDVLINGKKVSGILIEKGKSFFWAVGIGVNIKEAPNDEDLIYPATSLKDEGIEIDRIEFLKKFMNIFDAIGEEKFSDIRKEWLLYAKDLGCEIKVNDERLKLKGIFEGIDDEGILLLKTDEGIKKIIAGDIVYVEGN